jgi:hypothetical protein
MSPASFNALDLLRNEEVRRALASAWRESKPGLADRREEGGFILLDAKDTLVARRWPTGEANKIRVPPHRQCLFESMKIVASFHTHPNIEPEYLQEPGEADGEAFATIPI